MLCPVDLTQATQPKSTLGCPVLDGFLRGGFPCGIITEITGEAAAGKTQLVLQSLLTVQLPLGEGGLSGKAVYFYTEGKPPVERLQSILANRFSGRSDVSLDNVLIDSRVISSPDDLLRSIRFLENLLAQQSAPAPKKQKQQTASGAARQIRLVVIDSVAHVFRDAGAEGDNEPQVQQLTRRTAQLFTLASLLKRLAQRHHLAVLLTNQIMDDINHETGALEMGLPSTLRVQQPGAGGSRAAPLVSLGRRVLPALGLAWANCVNCRLFAARHDGWGGDTVRSLQVVFAPHLPHSFCCFRVNQDGVWGVSEDEDAQLQQQQQQQGAVPGAATSQEWQQPAGPGG